MSHNPHPITEAPKGPIIPLTPTADDDAAHLARLHTRLLHASHLAQTGVTNEEESDDLCRVLHSALGDVEQLIKAAVWREEVRG